jgi:hypothetical protein
MHARSRHTTIEEVLQAGSLRIRAALVATQICSKYISAALNQQTTIEEVEFSVDPAQEI